MVASKNLEDTPFLPESFTQLVRKKFHQFLGLCLGALAIGLSLALLSYSSLDPSYNVATTKPVGNFLGLFGSYISDFLYQSLGLTIWFVNICLYTWSFRIAKDGGLPRWRWRLAFIFPITLCLAGGLTIIPRLEFMGFSFGGFLGAGLVAGLSYIPYIPSFVWNGLLLVMGASASFWIMGLHGQEWLGFWGVLAKMGRFIVANFAKIYHKLAKTTINKNQNLHQELAEIEDLLALKAKYNFNNPLLETSEKLGNLSIETNSARHNVNQVIHQVMAKQPIDDESAHLPDNKPPIIIEQVAEVKKSNKILERHQGDMLDSNGEFSDYIYPSTQILAMPKKPANAILPETLQENARMLEMTLSDFGVKGVINEVRPGPVVALYELEPAPGTKTNRVIGLSDDIARSMSALSVRIATVPGRSVIGIEMPNHTRESVYLRELLESNVYLQSKAKLPMILGKDIGGTPVIADLATMPHLLIAGTTGSGKSVGMNAMIISLLYRYRPDECKFIMVDPKMLELSVYDKIPHLLSPVVTDPKKAVVALKWAVKEMEDRYRAMSRLSVRNIDGYNQKVNEAIANGENLTRKVQVGFDKATGQAIYEEEEFATKRFPYIVVVVDEMADLMLVAGKEIEASIQRLAQMARAAGIHLMMATQRPSVDVITGTIKANFPTRISFMVTSKIDSRTILGEQGAEQLLGKGDMLFMAPGGRINRVHGPFVEDKEVEAICDHLRSQGQPDYVEQVTQDEDEEFDEMSQYEMEQGGGDDYYNKAVALVMREGKASTSFLQRHLGVGYNKAAKIMEQMEKNGVVGPANHVGKREVLVGNNAA